MRLTKQHKIYAAVMGLALTALGMDRLVFSAPAPADAVAEAALLATAKPVARTAGAVRPVVTQGLAVVQASEGEAVAAQLDAVARTAGFNLEAVGDAFTPSTAWVKPAEAAVEVAKPVVVVVDDSFAKAHRLTAVMGSGQNGVAMINGVPVRVGQVVDKLTLISVSPRKQVAVLALGESRVELKLSSAEAIAVAGN